MPPSDGIPAPAELMVEVQRRLESLYELPEQSPVSDFLLAPDEASSLPGGGSRTLLRQEGEDIALGVVLEASVAEALRARDPRQRLDQGNLGPFCTLIEEVSHFVYLLFCAQAARTVTQLELELQGELDKYLSVVFLLSLQNEGAVAPGLREALFREYHLVAGLEPAQEERYRAASDLAFRYTGWLERTFLRESRLPDLRRESRRFYRLGQREKLERIASLQ
jgi:hypothetical protein